MSTSMHLFILSKISFNLYSKKKRPYPLLINCRDVVFLLFFLLATTYPYLHTFFNVIIVVIIFYLNLTLTSTFCLIEGTLEEEISTVRITGSFSFPFGTETKYPSLSM